MSRAADKMMGMSLVEFSDYDILHMVDDHSGETAKSLSLLMEVELRSLAMRFRWMRVHDLLERDTEGGWVVGPEGRQLLSRQGQRALTDIRRLADAAASDPGAGWAMNREWRRSLR